MKTALAGAVVWIMSWPTLSLAQDVSPEKLASMRNITKQSGQSAAVIEACGQPAKKHIWSSLNLALTQCGASDDQEAEMSGIYEGEFIGKQIALNSSGAHSCDKDPLDSLRAIQATLRAMGDKCDRLEE